MNIQGRTRSEMASENHCGVTAKSGHCKGMEEALEAHIKGKLRGKFENTFFKTTYYSFDSD